VFPIQFQGLIEESEGLAHGPCTPGLQQTGICARGKQQFGLAAMVFQILARLLCPSPRIWITIVVDFRQEKIDLTGDLIWFA